MRWWIRSSLVVATLALVLVIVARTRLNRPLLTVPDFSLTDANGQSFGRKNLAGRVWAADFIFTHCAGICLEMTFNLSRAQKDFFAQPGVRLVSVSVDPQRDTPARLREYAKSYDADMRRWIFLTGDMSNIVALARGGLRVSADENDPLMHGPHVVLVDQRGRIRGHYDATDPEEVKRLVADARKLESRLPAVNASLNAACALCLAAGFVMIRKQRKTAHIACMIAAVVISLVFLVCYLTYHAEVGSRPFEGRGVARTVYFAILLTHTVLAAAVALWLAPVTVARAARGRFDGHKRIARWTLPVWFYVSVTGVVIYFMLYHWYA